MSKISTCFGEDEKTLAERIKRLEDCNLIEPFPGLKES